MDSLGMRGGVSGVLEYQDFLLKRVGIKLCGTTACHGKQRLRE